jgi:hypothetical protein
MVVERGDESGVAELPVLGTSTIMRTRSDSLSLAQVVLSFVRELGFLS